MTDPGDLVGKRVVIQNPYHAETRWEGFALGYADFPTIEIEQDNGFRISLPAAWAKEATDD